MNITINNFFPFSNKSSQIHR